MREDIPWAVVKAIFNAAVEHPAEERATFLDEVCGNDAIRAEVERLLSSDAQAASFIDVPAWRATPAPSPAAVAEAVSSDPAAEPAERRVGPYHIKRVIGSGGMGTVYEATQARLRRVVALKVMKRGLASRSALRRFEYEAQILARLRHPGIAHVYDAGFHDDGSGGVPYFAMEYVPNARPITVFATRQKLDVRERLALFIRVCEAVHHGHQKGIIHRDLKPDNILVDASGHPKVIDFGVARATDSDLAVTTLQTDVGQLVGTVQYMSPEQVDADPHDIDVRSDVYTLGVVLFEMLCEEMPYDTRGKSILEASRVVVGSSPARLRAVNGALSGDLETIMLKALEKDRDRRYQSAVELARDVRRFLDDRPIEARPPSMARHMHLYARRHRAVVAATGVIAIGLVVATAVSIVFLLQARASARDARWAAYKATLVAVQSALEHEEEAVARERLESIPPALRGWERRLLNAQTVTTTVIERDETMTEVIEGVGPSGPFRLVGRRDGSIAQMTGLPPRPLRRLTGHEHAVWTIAVNDDGDVAASGDEGGVVRVWDLRTGEERARYDAHEGPVLALALDASGARVVSGGEDGTVRIAVIASAEAPRVLAETEGWVRSVDFSPDGASVAAAGRDKTLRVIDTATGALRHELPTKFWFNAARYLPDGRMVASTMSKTMVWTPGGDPPETLLNTDIVVLGLSRDRRRVLMGGSDRRVRVYDLDERRVTAEWRIPKADVRGVGFGADGISAFAIDSTGTARWWDATGEKPYVEFRGHSGRVTSIAFSPCGTRVATGGEDTTVRLWDALGGRLLATLQGHGSWVTDLVFTPDGTRLVSVSGDQTGRIWNPWTGAPLGTMAGHDAWIACAAMAPGGEVVATGAWDATVRLWSVANGESIGTLQGHEDSVWSLQYTGENTLVSSGWDRTVRVWNVADRVQTGRIELAQGGIFLVRDSRDGQRRATIGDTLEIVISDPKTGAVIVRRDGPEVVPAALRMYDDEERLISAWVDGGVRIHHLRTGEDLLVLRHDAKVSSMDLAADGRIAVGHYDGRARLWDAVPWPERQVERREIRAAEARVAPQVARLLSELVDAEAVVARVRADGDLSEVEKRAALNGLLETAAGADVDRPEVLARPEETPE